MQFQIGSLVAILTGAILLAFTAAWIAKTESAAYGRGLAIGFIVLFGRGCIEMFDPDPVQANLAAESFFWLFPLVLGWGVLGAIVVALALELKRMLKGTKE